MTNYDDAFVLAYEMAVSNLPGVTDGTIRQELAVSVHPEQEVSFDSVEALPLGASEAGATGVGEGDARPAADAGAGSRIREPGGRP